MKIQGKFLTALSFGLVACLAAVWPARAEGDVAEQIKALEAQVQQLKSQQMEIKKEATEAAMKMPSFRYRPGSGLTTTAADKSWSHNMNYRMDLMSYNTLGGKTNYDSDGTQVNTDAQNMKLVARRARFYQTFCWEDCFYQFNFTMDGEGDGGEAEFRDNELEVHFDHLNPYLPWLGVGPRTSAGRTSISRSSSSDVKMEHAAIIGAFGFSGAGSHSGINLHWEEVPIGPGEYEMHVNYQAAPLGAVYNEYNNSSRGGLMYFIGGMPFSKTKSKWLRGLDLGFGYQGASMDLSSNDNPEQVRPRLRNDQNRKNRVTLWRVNSGEVGRGWGQIFMPGVKWQVGPYFIRYMYYATGFKSGLSSNGASGVNGTGWTLDHQLNLWSPKGWFTGRPRSANSIVVGTGIERADVNCGRNCDGMPGDDGDNQTTDIHRQHYTTTYIGMWYYLSRGLGVGFWWDHVLTTNTPEETQIATGCSKNYAATQSGKGASKSCSWDEINVGMRFRW